jgi:hypothetical protein
MWLSRRAREISLAIHGGFDRPNLQEVSLRANPGSEAEAAREDENRSVLSEGWFRDS